jgi:hypothetical protein
LSASVSIKAAAQTTERRLKHYGAQNKDFLRFEMGLLLKIGKEEIAGAGEQFQRRQVYGRREGQDKNNTFH